LCELGEHCAWTGTGINGVRFFHPGVNFDHETHYFLPSNA
jgi:hypothetical protein